MFTVLQITANKLLYQYCMFCSHFSRWLIKVHTTLASASATLVSGFEKSGIMAAVSCVERISLPVVQNERESDEEKEEEGAGDSGEELEGEAADSSDQDESAVEMEAQRDECDLPTNATDLPNNDCCGPTNRQPEDVRQGIFDLVRSLGWDSC